VATAVHVKDVGLADFEQSVIDESFRRPVVVDFWAPWCGPCRILGPVLERLAEEFKGDFLLAKVNTEENPEIAQDFGIRSIPNVKVFKGGEVAGEFLGAISEAEARQFLRRHCPSDADRKYAEGLACLDAGQAQEARRAFEEALRADASHGGALLELGKILAAGGEAQAAASLWDRIPSDSPQREQAESLKQALEFHVVCGQNGGLKACANRAAAEPENLEARYAHGCCLAAGGDYRGALEEFLFVVTRNRNFREEAARKAMLIVFALAGERSPLAEEYRKHLAMVLF
jgi:putative thioredoxin